MVAIGYFLGLFKLGNGITLLPANNSLINELKNCEKIFSDRKKASLFHDNFFLDGIPQQSTKKFINLANGLPKKRTQLPKKR